MLSSAMVRGRKYGEMALKKIDSEYALVTISISRFHLHEIHMFFFSSLGPTMKSTIV